MSNLGTLNGDDCSWAFHVLEGQIVQAIPFRVLVVRRTGFLAERLYDG